MKNLNRRSFFLTTAGAAGAVSLAAAQPDWTVPVVKSPHRPVYHFLPPRNWMNDPNGLIQFKGEYHLFYQFAPDGPNWADSPMHWGHAKSPDLVRWQHLPIALIPDQPYDRAGVWSGCMVNDAGTATAMYTSVRPGGAQAQAIAVTTDMKTFTKIPGNPVIPAPPEGVNPLNFRDPYLFRHDGVWLCAVGAAFGGALGGTPAVLLYRSDDLRRFEYQGPLFTGDPVRHGRMFECPSFFELGGRWVLLVSPMTGRSNYFTGSFDGKTFKPDLYEELDRGGSLYAPQVFTDDRGRKIMFGWLKEDRRRANRDGWQGAQTLPRELLMGDDGRLRYRPVDEVESLRGPSPLPMKEQTLTGTTELGFESSACEAIFKLDPGRARRCGLVVRWSKKTGERTLIAYDAEKQRLEVDRSRSSLDPGADRSKPGAGFAPAPGQPLKLRVFVDRSVIEVFADDRLCLTSRVYPTGKDADGIGVFAEGGEARLISGQAFRMISVMEASTL